jgi:hypothetical protein
LICKQFHTYYLLIFLYFRMSIEYFQSTKHRRLNALSLYGDLYRYRMLCRHTISRINTETFLLAESLWIYTELWNQHNQSYIFTVWLRMGWVETFDNNYFGWDFNSTVLNWLKGQSRMDNPETSTTPGTKDTTKTNKTKKHNTEN